ncbi:MAG: MoaD/ThiS family protein [Actinomycetes bacterium]
MSVRVTLELPSVLADVAGGKRSLAVELHGTDPTVGDLLDLVAGVHPNLERRLRTESGQLRRHVNIYADGDDVRGASGIGTVLGQNAVVMVLPAVAGG